MNWFREFQKIKREQVELERIQVEILARIGMSLLEIKKMLEKKK